MTSPNLAVPHIAASQNQKEVTANEAFDRLDLALTGSLVIDASEGGTLEVTASQFRQNGRFVVEGTPAEAFVVQLPEVRRPFLARNITGQNATFRITASPGAIVVLQPDQHALIYATGAGGRNLHLVAFTGGDMDLHGAELVRARLRDYRETHQALGNVGGNLTVDLAAGNDASMTLTGDATLAFAGVAAGAAVTVTLTIMQDGTGGHAVTWPASVVWSGGVPPDMPSGAGQDAVFTLRTVDGGSLWRGFRAGAEFA